MLAALWRKKKTKKTTTKCLKKAEFCFFLYSTAQKREPQFDFLHKINIYSPSSNILQLYTVIHQSSFKFTEQHASILKALRTINPDSNLVQDKTDIAQFPRGLLTKSNSQKKKNWCACSSKATHKNDLQNCSVK